MLLSLLVAGGVFVVCWVVIFGQKYMPAITTSTMIMTATIHPAAPVPESFVPFGLLMIVAICVGYE